MLLIIALIAVIAGGLFAYQSQSAKYNFPFRCLENEALTFHIHPYIRIVINGQNITIPANIGIVQTGGSTCFQPVHTHDASGIIHIESPTNVNYTLADFFKIWNSTYHTISINGVEHPIVFNSTDILGFKADSQHKVILIVDGKQSSLYERLVLNTLNFCSASNSNIPPCYPTAGEPYYGGMQYPYGSGHTIVIEYIRA